MNNDFFRFRNVEYKRSSITAVQINNNTIYVLSGSFNLPITANQGQTGEELFAEFKNAFNSSGNNLTPGGGA